MKTSKTWLFLFVVVAESLSAQTITVMNRFKMPASTNAFYPVLNQNGDKILFTSDGYNGLSMYDLTTKSVTNISDHPGAGYEPMFDASDSKVF